VINFRFHIISLIAVFLALGIGIILGTAVIDRAVVDRLERQQSSLRSDIDEVRSTNRQLEQELDDERDVASRLADEGSQRLLSGTLVDTPVLLLATRGAESEGLDDLVTLLGRANAELLGTLWLTDRFVLDDDDEVRELAAALAVEEDDVADLRSIALSRIAVALRPVPSVGASDESDTTIPNLRQAGFLDFDSAPGGNADEVPVMTRGTRLVLFSGRGADVPDRQLMLPLTRAVVAPREDREAIGVLAVGSAPPAEPADDTFIVPIREDESLDGKLSTVDDIDDFSGRLATVLALVDLGVGRVGDFGRGPGAQQLLPAPAS
jgi:hypothetical protein